MKIRLLFDFIVEAVDLLMDFVGFVVLPALSAFLLIVVLLLIVGMWP